VCALHSFGTGAGLAHRGQPGGGVDEHSEAASKQGLVISDEYKQVGVAVERSNPGLRLIKDNERQKHRLEGGGPACGS